MKLNLLLERIYPELSELTTTIGNFLKKELKQDYAGIDQIDITKLIPKEYNKNNKKVSVKYSNTIKRKKLGVFNHTESNNRQINIVLNWKGNFQDNWSSKRDAYFNILKHEINHVLDLLRMFLDKEVEETDPSLKYYKDYYEFNQMINVISEYKKLQPISWKKISSFEKIYDIIDKHGYGLQKLTDDVKKNKAFRKKLRDDLRKYELIPPLLSNL